MPPARIRLLYHGEAVSGWLQSPPIDDVDEIVLGVGCASTGGRSTCGA